MFINSQKVSFISNGGSFKISSNDLVKDLSSKTEAWGISI